MTVHTIEITCDETYHDGRPATVERFIVSHDPELGDDPDAWSVGLTLEAKGDPAPLREDDSFIPRAGLLGQRERGERHTYSLRCHCGLSKPLRDDILRPILIRAALQGRTTLPFSWFLRL